LLLGVGIGSILSVIEIVAAVTVAEVTRIWIQGAGTMRLGHNDGLSAGSKVLGRRVWRRVERVEGSVRVECLVLCEAWCGGSSRAVNVVIDACGGLGHRREWWWDKRKAL
jgi:hypothetical protein